ncbi:glycosyl transferase family 4-domain-containing protein [Dipodascopsis tothii]|uniref:glycosyl transferase family 4-domain-containing protein n=1 Tax=Dipodascopsis tothii TaxID=44089 RepID=UPI0034CF0B89
MIPAVAPQLARIGLRGRDLSKTARPELPETVGAVCAVVYVVGMFFFIPCMFFKYLVTETSGSGNRDVGIEDHARGLVAELSAAQRAVFPHSKLAEYLSALLSLVCMFVLGVADDLFDIRWRTKLFLPAVAVLPLMIVYYVDFGVTRVAVPAFLGLGNAVDLGWLYYGYMAAVAIFCPNSINILAGVNGLEAGQALVICGGLLLNDAFYIFARADHPALDAHLFSTYFVLPWAAVTLALLRFNWFPARVFVGDTYCYFAGMVFAVVGILGHFSKTLLLFFLPQIFNFIYSAPQLFKVVDCPRHRMPRFDAASGLLEPSTVPFPRPPTGARRALLLGLARCGLIALDRAPDGTVRSASNMTLINLVLTKTGPLREDRLAAALLAIQAASCVTGLVFRHTAAVLIFGRDNLS